MKEEIKIVAVSDTHGYHRDVDVPYGDVFIHAGDLMTCGYKFNEVKDFAQWFTSLPHPNKILVAGNHDRLFEGKDKNSVYWNLLTSHNREIFIIWKTVEYLLKDGTFGEVLCSLGFLTGRLIVIAVMILKNIGTRFHSIRTY